MYGDVGRSEEFKTYIHLRVEEMMLVPIHLSMIWSQIFCRIPHTKATLLRLENMKLKATLPTFQSSTYKLPSGPIETRPLDAEQTVNKSTGGLNESYICGRHFLKGTSKDECFKVLSSFYSPAIGRTFDVVRAGQDCSVKTSEADLKDLLKDAVEILLPEGSN
jgi:hypothetical protein